MHLLNELQQNTINVAIALIKKGTKYLVSRRRSDAHLPGLWEFPGGKQIPNETLEECVVREVLEELSVEIKIDLFYGQFKHAYPDKTVTLYPYLCHIISGTPVSAQEIKWVFPQELLSLRFPEANIPLITKLINELGV